MCLVAFRITEELPVAEDIVAETFLKLFNRRREFQSLDNIKAFLFVSVRNASITYKATRSRHRAAHLQIAQTLTDPAEIPPAIRLEFLEAELLHLIYREMDNLPDKCREVFRLIYLEGLGTDQIAAQMGISPQTVRTQKARALQLLKAGVLTNNPWLLPALFSGWFTFF